MSIYVDFVCSDKLLMFFVASGYRLVYTPAFTDLLIGHFIIKRGLFILRLVGLHCVFFNSLGYLPN